MAAKLPLLVQRLAGGASPRSASAIAHYIAGVLDRESMTQIVENLSEVSELKAGDRVKTLRGTTRGKVLRILDDGKVVWQPSGSRSELIALPESLLREK